MKDMMGNSIADDAEFDDLDDFDYVDQFVSKEDEGDDSSDINDELDDLDDLYVDEGEEIDDLGSGDEGFEDEESEDEDIEEDEDEGDLDEELEAKFICEECGHKWLDYITETDEENDLLEISCPLCGSQNVSMER
jgi:rubrerythrin